MKNIVEKIRRYYKKDGVLPWLVCSSAFVAYSIISGIDSSFGEPFASIMKDFNSSETNVAWIGSVHSSAAFFAASLSSILAERFGFIPVIAIGILMSTTFFALCITAHNLVTLTLYYGFFAGFGLGLIYTPAHIICSFHFIKRRSLATGIAICGAGAGIVLVSAAMNFIDVSYGWTGCVILCACICPFGFMLLIMVYILPEDYVEPSVTENEINHLDEGYESNRQVRLNLYICIE